MTQLLSLIDLNLTELNYVLFMISQDQCNWSCNVVDLSMKIFVTTETNDVNIKVFNIITRIDLEFPVIVNANSIVQHVI